VCNIDLIEHIVQETKNVFKGTTCEETHFFYHDALSQMTNKETQEWMRGKQYLDMWVLPINGCNARTIYTDRPVGDLPEMIPLDCSLFEDLHAGVHRHVSTTYFLENDDPKMFSLASPTHISSAYTHLFKPAHGTGNGIPSSKQILEDCKNL